MVDYRIREPKDKNDWVDYRINELEQKAENSRKHIGNINSQWKIVVDDSYLQSQSKRLVAAMDRKIDKEYEKGCY